jgi:hypothetical protein
MFIPNKYEVVAKAGSTVIAGVSSIAERTSPYPPVND